MSTQRVCECLFVCVTGMGRVASEKWGRRRPFLCVNNARLCDAWKSKPTKRMPHRSLRVRACGHSCVFCCLCLPWWDMGSAFVGVVRNTRQLQHPRSPNTQAAEDRTGGERGTRVPCFSGRRGRVPSTLLPLVSFNKATSRGLSFSFFVANHTTSRLTLAWPPEGVVGVLPLAPKPQAQGGTPAFFVSRSLCDPAHPPPLTFIHATSPPSSHPSTGLGPVPRASRKQAASAVQGGKQKGRGSFAWAWGSAPSIQLEEGRGPANPSFFGRARVVISRTTTRRARGSSS